LLFKRWDFFQNGVRPQNNLLTKTSRFQEVRFSFLKLQSIKKATHFFKFSDLNQNALYRKSARRMAALPELFWLK
jgi:hypothetical protein